MSGEANQALDLDELKALCAAATEGPWTVPSWAPRLLVPKLWAEDAIDPDQRGSFMSISVSEESDVRFIAAARSAVPALIAEVERLTKERDEARSALESVRDFAVAVEKQNHDALEVARGYWKGPRGPETHLTALLDIQRLLETENQ